MTKNTKTQKMQKTKTSVFVQNCRKKEMEIFAFCVISFEAICSAPQNDSQSLSFVKVGHTYGEKWPEKVVQRSFVKEHSFPNGL